MNAKVVLPNTIDDSSLVANPLKINSIPFNMHDTYLKQDTYEDLFPFEMLSPYGFTTIFIGVTISGHDNCRCLLCRFVGLILDLSSCTNPRPECVS